MKRKLLICLAVAAVLALALSFAGCAKPVETPPAAAPEPEHAAPTQLAVPTEAEVTAAYEKAREAYNWFDMTTLPTSSEGGIDEDYMTYYPVEYTGITTMAELEAYLKTIFADEVVSQLMTINEGEQYAHYKDIDGVLYALPADRGGDIFKGEETYEVIVNGGDEIDYRVSVEVYDDPATMNVVDTEVYDFMYTDPTQSGEWRFANFESVR